MTPPALVAVVGSANLDLIARVTTPPRPGESVLGTAFTEAAGGKGVNQAIAAARTTATAFIGSIGTDPAGQRITRTLSTAGVDTSCLLRSDAPTGRALIVVDDTAENAIVVVPQANHDLPATHVRAALTTLRPTVLLCQLETPHEAVRAAAEWARSTGTRFVLNLSPADAAATALIRFADPLIVNEHEARLVTLLPDSDIREVAQALAAQAASVVITLGRRGSIVAANQQHTRVASRTITAVDTTGAGDAFAGTVAAHLTHNPDLVAAVKAGTDQAARVVATERADR